MIDLHAHILPGVDDGPATWDDSLEILRLAAKDGIRHIVGTSHMLPDGPYANERAKLLALITELQERSKAEGLPISVHAGGEVYLTPDTVQRLQAGRALTYCDAGKYMLVELPSSEIPSYAEQALFDLQLQGITPIIAHAERNLGVIRSPQRLFDFVRRGVLVQVTASSLRAKPFAETAELLIRHRAAHFVATDTHGVNRRPPTLSKYRQHLANLVGHDGARRLLQDNAQCVIQGDHLETEPVQPLSPRRKRGSGLLQRLFSSRP